MPAVTRPFVLAALAAVLVSGCGGAATPAAEPAAPAPAPAAAPSAVVTPTAPEGIGPGEWLVGVDVEPGTYRSAGPDEDGGYCMWSRKDAAGAGALDNIIASDGSYDAAQMLVTIEESDVVFRTRGCEPFERVS